MRVYVSSTYEDLKEHRLRVRDAILDLGHDPRMMEHYPALAGRPVDECLKDVASCNVCVSIVAWRYGYIPPGCRASITELELRKAAQKRIPVLAFLLHEGHEWPASCRDTAEKAAMVRALRDSLMEERVVKFFTDPDDLYGKVIAALAALRADGGERVQGPKFADVRGFRDRDQSRAELRRSFSAPERKLICVIGRGGTGKTWLLQAVADEIEAGALSLEQAGPRIGADGIIYLNCSRERPPVERLFEKAGRMLGSPHAEELAECWRDVSRPMADRVGRLLSKLQDGAYLLLLDQFEAVLEADGDTITDPDLRTFMELCMEVPHALRIAATSRQAPDVAGLVGSECAELPLNDGLPVDDAVDLLRDLVGEHAVEVSDADLREVARRCACLPGALRAFAAWWRKHRRDPKTSDLSLVLKDEAVLARIVEDPAREVYEALSPDKRLVLQALAVLDACVPADAVKEVLPQLGERIEGLLDELVREGIVGHDRHARCFMLAPPEQRHAYSRAPNRVSWWARLTWPRPRPVSKRDLHLRAAAYYAVVGEPPDAWRSRDDIAAQLAQFRHLVGAGEHDEAYWVLDSFHKRLWSWGHCEEVQQLHETLRGRLGSPLCEQLSQGSLGVMYSSVGRLHEAMALHRAALQAASSSAGQSTLGRLASRVGLPPVWPRRWRSMLLGNLGVDHWGLAELAQAVRCYEQALAIDRDIGDAELEGVHLGDLGVALQCLGRFDAAVERCREGIPRSLEASDRRVASNQLACIGTCQLLMDDPPHAEESFREGLSLALEANSAAGLCYNHSGLARCALLRDDPVAALASSRQAHVADFPRHRHWAAFLLGLSYGGSATPETALSTLEEAVNRCQVLLDSAPRNFEALYCRAASLLALGRYNEADAAYREALAVCPQAGVVKDAVLDLRLVRCVLPQVPGLDDVESRLQAALQTP